MGYLVAIEGIDGSGKGTQAKRLLERLKAEGQRATLLSFPRYDATFFGRAVGDFLNGAFGSLDQVHPFFSALLFAGDRFESRSLLADALAGNDVVVLDRYVASNVAHQAARLEGTARERLIAAIEYLEFELYRLPRPDLTVLLDLSVSQAQHLIANKPARSYTGTPPTFKRPTPTTSHGSAICISISRSESNWSVIGCEQHGLLRPIGDIAEEIGSLVLSRRSS